METLVEQVLLLFLAVLGIVELIRVMILWAVTPGRNGRMRIVVPIGMQKEEAEGILRSAILRLRWLGVGEPGEILCVDCGMDAETREICEAVCLEYPFVQILKVEEIEQVFRCKKEENVV